MTVQMANIERHYGLVVSTGVHCALRRKKKYCVIEVLFLGQYLSEWRKMYWIQLDLTGLTTLL